VHGDVVLSARGLTCGHNRQAFVRDFSLDLHAGEVSVHFGVNGAGKTTTLLTLSSLLAPVAGRIELRGTPIETTRSAHRMLQRGLAHVPDDRGLFPGLTVEQHLRLVQGSTTATIDFTYDSFPQLRAVRDRRAGLLSGGEQQMLAVARAVLAGPGVLLIDEMSTGLAPMIVMQLMQTIRSMADDRAIAVLLVEQHVGLALAVADTVTVLAHGLTALRTTADEVRSSPGLLEHAYFGGDTAA
jgi:branched-chain amino acid transport system ATP-binding protein